MFPLIVLAVTFALTACKKGDRHDSKITGTLYMQTNGIKNEIIQYARMNDGNLAEVQRIATGGAGSGTYKPIYDEPNQPNAFEGVKSIILTADNKWLFTTNGGNNSVSSFKVADNGSLTLIDVQPTGQPVSGKSGTAKSLAYAENTHTLYVCHAFGPDHIHMFSVNNGMLTQKPGSYTANIGEKHRVTTEIVLTPDNKFLMVNNLFDQRPGKNPDGTPIVVVANMVDKDGLVVFPVNADGSLGTATFQDAGGAAGFDLAFLHGSNNTFINSYAASGGIAMCTIDALGKVTCSPVVMINQQIGMPSELCWIQISPDNRHVYTTEFGYSYVSTFKIDNGSISVQQDPAAEAVPGDGTFKALDKVVSSGPNDSWLSPDGKYFYQIYPNASKLIAYRVNGESGKLNKIDTKAIPYTSPQGLAGFDYVINK
ncbi:MAG: beta-propeller fold lactonase family protein [Chitinophagaceae bacterium]|nr:beta-propeller fold lactonase family protein [Chitinophagaceae bacterium]